MTPVTSLVPDTLGVYTCRHCRSCRVHAQLGSPEAAIICVVFCTSQFGAVDYTLSCITRHRMAAAVSNCDQRNCWQQLWHRPHCCSSHERFQLCPHAGWLGYAEWLAYARKISFACDILMCCSFCKSRRLSFKKVHHCQFHVNESFSWLLMACLLSKCHLASSLFWV